jgi:hypothetical protein
MKYYISTIAVALILHSFSCSTMPKSKVNTENKKPKEVVLDFSTGAPTIIYKSKEAYNNKVPVTLSEDKKKIVSYPHPKDIYYNGKLGTPTSLSKGYLLDNRGVGKNTALLNITYEEYSKLNSAPKLAELERMIREQFPSLTVDIR